MLDLGPHFVHHLSLLLDEVSVFVQKTMWVQAVENRHAVEQLLLSFCFLV
jgi:hypothetical protein